MSEEQLKAFLEKLKGDTTLQAKLKAAADSDAVVSIAKEAGINISVDDLKNAQSKLKLSDEELDSVVGGGGMCFEQPTIEWVTCGWNTVTLCTMQ